MPNFSSSTTAEVIQNISFELTDLGNYSDYTNLFDQYRIKRATIMVMPRISETITADVLSNPVMYSVPDFDGSALTTLSSMLEYESCRIHDARKPFLMVIDQPRFLVTAGTTDAGKLDTGWLDLSSPGIPHYGVAIGLPAQPVVTVWYIHARLELEFRNTR